MTGLLEAWAARELQAEPDVRLFEGDCLEVLKGLADNSVDACVTDPPYHLTSIVKRFGGANAAPAKEGTDGAFKRASRGFMGKEWDGGDIAFQPELWAEVLRVLKPGGYCVAFSGTRTYHRMAVAIEDAGFDIRDQLGWVYGSGFPKSLDISKAIDKAAGAERTESLGPSARHNSHARGSETSVGFQGGIPELFAPATDAARQWAGYGTALKPAWEPICLARKPLDGTNVENVLKWGVGALNIDGCRVGDEVRHAAFTSLAPCSGNRLGDAGTAAARRGTQGAPKEYVGRFPANILHDGSDEVLAAFPNTKSGALNVGHKRGSGVTSWDGGGGVIAKDYGGDSGSAARFFYCAKANKADRADSKHPTVKPVALMRWLCRLVTPPGGVVLDPFAGSGTTGQAAVEEGFTSVLIEREAEYIMDIKRRLGL